MDILFQSKCECGSVVFELETDDNEGVARRLCIQCGAPHFLCDSIEHWSEAEPELSNVISFTLILAWALLCT